MVCDRGVRGGARQRGPSQGRVQLDMHIEQGGGHLNSHYGDELHMYIEQGCGRSISRFTTSLNVQHLAPCSMCMSNVGLNEVEAAGSTGRIATTVTTSDRQSR